MNNQLSSSPASATVRPRGALSNAGWNAFSTLFSITMAMLMAPLLINRLGTEQWGLVLLVWSVSGVLGMANFGVGEATLRFIARYYAEGDLVGVNRILGATLTFYGFICSVISAVLFVATPTVGEWVKVPADARYPIEWLLRLTALLFSFGMLANAFRSVSMAMQRYDISSRIGLVQSIVRYGGLIAVVLAGMGVLQVVLWEVLVALAVLVTHIVVARKLLPGVRWTPSMSVSALREISGYSVFSFLTHIFLTMYREAGKLVLGNRAGPASVAYLGTPDSIAYRLHMVVISGIETLMPRFSGSRSPEEAKPLLVTSTWAALMCGIVLYVPLALLMPDLLRLWINPTFARESAGVGQLLALSFIAPAAFAPIATLFRGVGKPSFVTLVMVLAGVAVLVSSLALVASHGVLAVGYGYMLSGIPWLGGLFGGWVYLYGFRSPGPIVRAAVLPLLLGCILGVAESAVLGQLRELGWIGLFAVGGVFGSVNALSLIAVDRALGGDSPAGQILGKVLASERLARFRPQVAHQV